MSKRLSLIVSLMVASFVLYLFGQQDTALATHLGGAVYTGTHAGGGTVSMTISDDGLSVARFSATNVPGSGCTVSLVTVTFDPQASRIYDEQLSYMPGFGLSLTATFAPNASASGTLQNLQDGFGCSTGVFNWTATPGSSGSTPTPTSTSTRTPIPSSTVTTTPTPTPTVTPTPLPPVSCSPRPPVTVSVTRPGANRLRATIMATGTNNSLLEIKWTAPTNATVELPNGTRLVNSYKPSAGSSSVALVLRRASGSRATLPLEIQDRCGTWHTFFGGGQSAW
jgi:hypothetical protein